MPNPILGSIPRGEDYFGREDLIEKLWMSLENGNVLIEAPRRFGKTGAMYQLLDYPRYSYKPIFMNVQEIRSASNFIVELLAKLIHEQQFRRILSSVWDKTKDFGNYIRNLPAEIDIGGVKVKIREQLNHSADWLSYGDRVMSLLVKEDLPLLLLIDEFPIMIWEIAQRDPEETKNLLRWLRTIRLAPDTTTRFVFGGSINLLSTLDYMGLADTVNDLRVIKIRPFDPETAKRYIQSIFDSKGIALSPDVLNSILELVGAPIPYLLAVLLVEIFDRQRIEKGPVTISMVQSAFYEDLLDASAASYFIHYRGRIRDYYPDPEDRAAKSILDILSRQEMPVKKETLYTIFLKACGFPHSSDSVERFNQLMSKLDNDFYIMSENDSYTFHSRALKLWWKAKYGFQGDVE